VPDHARLIYPAGGRAYFPQRFATDWVKVGPNGKLFSGDSTRNENWYSYGQEVVAVAEGTVRAVRDGVANNTPPEVTERMTTQTVAGNFVLLDLGDGRLAFYGHLAPHSIAVREGQRVERGAVIGQIGNTGNSTGPHLHFHLVAEPGVPGLVGAAQGAPFVFDQFEEVGRISREQFDATDRGIPIGPFEARGRTHVRDLPLGGMVVNFHVH
jgi:hypothetical protein